MGLPAWVPATFGALAIVCGAFGSHGLKNKVDAYKIDVWNTAAHYHLVHSVALLGLHVLDKVQGPKASRVGLASKLIVTGTLLFSGSLYFMVLTDIKKVGIITPIGGVFLIAGWIAMAL